MRTGLRPPLAVLVLLSSAPVAADDFRLHFAGPETISGPAGSTVTRGFDSLLSHEGDGPGALGWAIGVAADGAVIRSIAMDGTVAASRFADGFLLTALTSGPGNEGAVLVCTLGSDPATALPTNSDSSIATVEVEFRLPHGPGQAGLRYRDGLTSGGAPPVATVVTHGETSIKPGLSVHRIRLEGNSLPRIPFIRGDADGSGDLTITDAIGVLGALFLGGSPIGCAAAGDADGNVAAEITDAIVILGHLFTGGGPPAPPYPSCGLDPDPQGLPCEEYRGCPAPSAPCGIDRLAAAETADGIFLSWSPRAAQETCACREVLLRNPRTGAGVAALPGDAVSAAVSWAQIEDAGGFICVECAGEAGAPTIACTEIRRKEPVNRRPTAHAGGPLTAIVGRVFELDGSRSRDPDGDPLSFFWSLLSRPDGSAAGLEDDTNVRPFFIPDLAGDYSFELFVTDGGLESEPIAIQVTALADPAAADSDQNGIPDGIEWGPLSALPLDTDGDQVPDHRDVDDDGDGILDTHDSERLIALEPADPFDAGARLLLLDGGTDLGGDDFLPGIARAGGELVLSGSGFTGEIDENLLLFIGSEFPINVRPSAVSSDEIRARVPRGPFDAVAVLSGGRISNALPLAVLAENAPVLLPPEVSMGEVGSALVLRGRGLAAVGEVSFAGARVLPDSVADGRIEVTIPPHARTGRLTALAADLESNAVAFRVVRTVRARVVIPEGLPAQVSELVLFSGLASSRLLDAKGTAEVALDRSGADFVDTVVPGAGDGPGAVILRALALPGDGFVEVNSLSTAVAMVLGQSGFLSAGQTAGDLGRLREVREALFGLAQVRTLGDAIAAALRDDPEGLRNPSESLTSSLLEAATAAAPLMGRGAVAGGRPGGGGTGEADIVPPTRFGISIFSIDGTGNIGVRNSTALFLSTEIRSMDSGKVLQRHIRRAFDGDAVSPEGGILLGTLDSKKEYRQPNYLNASVEVLSPGALEPQPSTTDGRRVQKVLYLRTLLDRVIMPIVTTFTGFLPDQQTSAVVMNLLLEQFPAVIDDTVNHLREGNARSAITLVLNAVLRDFENLGPFARMLVDRVLVKKLLGKLDGADPSFLKSVAARFQFVLRNAAIILKVAGAAATGFNIGLTVIDIEGTAGVLPFEVFYRLSIQEISPFTVQRGGFTAPIRLKGGGFRRGGDGIQPLITLIDKGGGPSPSVTTAAPAFAELDSVSEDGTRAYFVLKELYLAEVEGPIEVTLAAGGETAIAPREIDVTGELRIDSIDPPRALPGQALTIRGDGFRWRENIQVVFRAEALGFSDDGPPVAGEPIEVRARADGVFPKAEIRVKVPELSPCHLLWKTHVEQGSITRRVRSNAVPFERRGIDGNLVYQNFVRTGRGESLSAPFTNGSGTSTKLSYIGLVEVVVSGIGWSYYTYKNDAFYMVDPPFTGKQAEDPYYKLNIAWLGFPFRGGKDHNIANFIVFIDEVGPVAPGTMPAYDAGHTYRFVIDIPDDLPTLLTFGVSDGKFFDNGGSYAIELKELKCAE